MAQASLVVDLAIAADQYQLLYTGRIRAVSTQARDGRRVEFPARILQPFVEHRGVYGTFELSVSPQGKLLGIRKLAPLGNL